MTPETALANRETMNGALALSGPIAKALQVSGMFDQVRSGAANLVSPMVAIDQVPEGSRISVRGVVIDPDKETYPQAGGKVALLKVALDKIARTAQVDWAYCDQVDNWNDPYRVRYHAVAVVTNFDGTRSRLVGSKVVDLRKTADFIGEDARGMSDKELAQARKHIHPLCESKAKNRAIRSLGIPATMSKVDAAKPWVIVALVPDTSDPDVKRLYIEGLAAASSACYGMPKALPGPSREPVIDLEPEEEEPEDNPHGLAPGEHLNGFGVIHTPGEVHRTEPSAEPWDMPEEPPAPPHRLALPLSREALAALPEERRPWFARLNELCQAVYDKYGPEIGHDHLASAIPESFDPATAPATEVAKLGAALKALA